MILYGWSLESVMFSLESLEFMGIEGVRNREKSWNSMLWNGEISLEFQHRVL